MAAAAGGVQVVVEDPAAGDVAVGSLSHVAGLVGGVGAQQVVEGVPARSVLGDQAITGELAQQAAGLRLVRVPARLAAARTLMSGPGCRPSSRNIRAAVGLSCR